MRSENRDVVDRCDLSVAASARRRGPKDGGAVDDGGLAPGQSGGREKGEWCCRCWHWCRVCGELHMFILVLSRLLLFPPLTGVPPPAAEAVVLPSRGMFFFIAHRTHWVGVLASFVPSGDDDRMSSTSPSSRRLGRFGNSSGGMPFRIMSFWACLLMYMFCSATAPPPPMSLSKSPLGLSLMLSCNWSRVLSSSAGESFSRSFGDDNSSSISRSSFFVSSLTRRSLIGLGRTIGLTGETRKERLSSTEAGAAKTIT